MSKKTLTLMSKDNHLFNVEEELAVQSVTIKNMVEEDCASSIIPLPNVDAQTLALVIKYLNQKPSVVASEDDNDANEFVEELDISMLLELAKAASYLDIKGLMDMACAKVADMIKNFTVEKVREVFGIENDYTPEEEQKLRDEFDWAFKMD